MDPVFYFALTFTVFLVFALIFAPVLLRPSPAARRMMEMVRSNRPDERGGSFHGEKITHPAGDYRRRKGQTAARERGN
jgi:hypothetical protein